MKEIVSVKWLVIDESGRVNVSDFSEVAMGEIVDTRYRMALKKQAMTVLISNDPPEQVLSAYLVDRVRDVKNKVMVIQGKSLRKGV
jgi:DNA replication protein DnaC